MRPELKFEIRKTSVGDGKHILIATPHSGVKEEDVPDRFHVVDSWTHKNLKDSKIEIVEKESCVYGYDKLPWEDIKSWRKDWVYPLPVGSMWMEEVDFTYFEGYNIFKIDPECDTGEDILPVGLSGTYGLLEAVEICEAINRAPMPGMDR